MRISHRLLLLMVVQKLKRCLCPSSKNIRCRRLPSPTNEVLWLQCAMTCRLFTLGFCWFPTQVSGNFTLGRANSVSVLLIQDYFPSRVDHLNVTTGATKARFEEGVVYMLPGCYFSILDNVKSHPTKFRSSDSSLCVGEFCFVRKFVFLIVFFLMYELFCAQVFILLMGFLDNCMFWS